MAWTPARQDDAHKVYLRVIMGSMRNAVKRRTHKERSQPLARRKYGLLEKRKDYRLRAKDYHKKEDTLKVLRQKAEERNPDEFYFGMQNAQTQEGVHIKESTTANKYTPDELRLMQTQDIKYIALKAQTDAKKIEKLQQRLHLVGAPSQSKHTLFVDDESELRQFSAAEHFQTPEELLERSFNRPRKDQLLQSGAVPPQLDFAQEAKLNRFKASAYRELAERTERHQKLQGLVAEMARKKELMGKGSVRKLKGEEGDEKPIFKWRLERKK